MTGPLDPLGALVISLDFELHWGVRDYQRTDGPYRGNLLGVWEAVPRMLDLFAEFEVAATWATVGFLFASSRSERLRYQPASRPAYLDPTLSPYDEPTGESEADDRLHYAPTLIAAVRRTPRQEIGTHTFSHYYCLEPGQHREHFDADLASAVAIAADDGVALQSIVFPRNQHNPSYDDLLQRHGLRCYRGNARGWMYAASAAGEDHALKRAARLLDTYLPLGDRTFAWDEVVAANGLCNVPASIFLRPVSPRLRALEGLRLSRIAGTIRSAATRGRLVHLWWHPHNFGVRVGENITFLRRVLEVFAECRERYGMRSLTMSETAEVARELASR